MGRILTEDDTLIRTVTDRLSSYPDLNASIGGMLMEKTTLTYNPRQESTRQMQTCGSVRNDKVG